MWMHEIARRAVLTGIGGLVVAPPVAAASPAATVHLDPGCGCCRVYVEHLRRAGFAVRVESHDDLAPIKARARVPADLEACHTTFVGDYAIEGHVPAAAIRRLLAERPAAWGLAVPGMPAGSPGMEGGTPEAYSVFLFGDDGSRRAWMRFIGLTRV